MAGIRIVTFRDRERWAPLIVQAKVTTAEPSVGIDIRVIDASREVYFGGLNG